MPDSRSLTLLRRRLEEAMRPGPVLLSDPWVDPLPIRQARREVERKFDCAGEMPSGPSLRQAVLRYSSSGSIESFSHLKHVCYGVTLPLDESKRCLLDQGEAFTRLLQQVDGYKDEVRRFRRCYQALMQSYFALEPNIEAKGIVLKAGGRTLRGYLSDRLSVAALPVQGRQAPQWILTLKDHQNLLTDRPCDRYVRDLQAGHGEELNAVCDVLGISRTSWIWQAVVLAYLQEIIERPDDPFKAAIGNALDLADGRAGLPTSSPIARFIVASVVKRYRRSSSHPELARLRDAAVEKIGNPWLHRQRWDAWVEDESARQMIDSWLKSRLLEDFFTLLSDQIGGATDQRRLNYWLRFVPAIEDMWFVLGSAAARSRSTEFVEMRRRMDGRWSHLTGGTDPRNNAFIMKMGGYLFIEFGMKGNACYYYDSLNLPFDPSATNLSIYRLKAGSRAKSHMHYWEVEFDRTFCPLIGYWPGRQAPTTQSAPTVSLGQILEACNRRGIEIDDRRQKGGSLWLAIAAGEHQDLVPLLKQCGFEYSVRLKQFYLEA